MLLLLGPVELLCGKFLFIKFSERPVWISDRPIATSLSIHAGSVRQ